MNLIITIAPACMAFGGLITYSLWWFFWSKEAIILKKENMGSYNESTAILEKDLAKLEGRRAQMEAELINNYSEEKLRELNIIDHKIRVARERVTGQWVKDGLPEYQVLK